MKIQIQICPCNVILGLDKGRHIHASIITHWKSTRQVLQMKLGGKTLTSSLPIKLDLSFVYVQVRFHWIQTSYAPAMFRLRFCLSSISVPSMFWLHYIG